MVRDATTGRPIVGALLRTTNPVWGFRSGQLVWDKESVATTVSGADGGFRFKVAGGTGLNVKARGYPPVDTSFCPQGTLVLMGGPHPQLRTDRRLVIADKLSEDDQEGAHPAALARELGLRISGSIFERGSILRIEGPGVRFVPGTGAIPPAPRLPYGRMAEIDLARQCGWFFISDGEYPIAVVQAAHPFASQSPGGPWRWFLMYAPLVGASTSGRAT